MTPPPQPSAPSEQALRRRLVQAGHILAALGQGDMTRGHLSARLPQAPGLFLMKPHSMGFDELTEAGLLTVDLDGKVVVGTGRRHSEVFIHSEIYRSRPDVGAVLHSHPLHMGALSAAGMALLPLSQPAALFAGDLGHYEASIGLVRSPEAGRAVAEALGAHRAVVLRHHGIACTGPTIEECTIGAVMLENAARIQLLAAAAGPLDTPFAPEDVAALRRDLSQPDQFRVNFDYLARRFAPTV